MKQIKKSKVSTKAKDKNPQAEYFTHFWEESWTYIRTVVDVLREPVLILDKELKVLAANESFYILFQVKPADTEGKKVYDLGNGQWDIPKLRNLLEDILPKDTFFKGFEVEHEFPSVGRKTIMLNARHIYSQDPETCEFFPPLIMLAMEDITSLMTMANTLTEHTNQLEQMLNERTGILEAKINVLEKEIRKYHKE